jgi:hypothetical protein
MKGQILDPQSSILDPRFSTPNQKMPWMSHSLLAVDTSMMPFNSPCMPQ